MLAGKAVEYAEPNAIEGGTLMPLELRFYVSEVELIRSDTSTVAVDIVTNAGTPVPYGVHLVNAEDPASLRFSLLAPPGSYSGVSFTFGLKESCNTGLMDRKAPLSAASQMTWPHTFGYLFLRYAGMFQPAGDVAPNPAGGGAARPPGVIHMGGVPGRVHAPRVHARGEITAGVGARTSVRLAFDFDELFRGANTSMDLSDYVGLPLEEVLAGERVRRLAPELDLFTIVSP
jgi:hypothetical protein